MLGMRPVLGRDNGHIDHRHPHTTYQDGCKRIRGTQTEPDSETSWIA